jgi:hypothetical protein
VTPALLRNSWWLRSATSARRHLVDEHVDPRAAHRDAEALARAGGRHEQPNRFDLLAMVGEVAVDDRIDRAGAVVGDVQDRDPTLAGTACSDGASIIITGMPGPAVIGTVPTTVARGLWLIMPGMLATWPRG